MGRLISRKVIMRKCYVLWALVLSAVTAAKVPNPEKLKSDVLQRFKRQDLDEDALEKQLCSDKGAGEWFRLETGKDKCRDVIQCTSSGLQAIRCPAGLAFDIEKQTCDWKDSVKNCDAKTKEKKVKPLLFTDEPLCQEGFLACGDGNCIERVLFCNGEKIAMMAQMKTHAILTPTPTEHHLVIPRSVNCLTVSVQRMVPKYLEICVKWALLDPTAKMSLK